MELLTQEILEEFETQGDTSGKSPEDIKVICKFFNPCGSGTWHAVEYDPKTQIFFGYVSPVATRWEFGKFPLYSLESLRFGFGLQIERDIHFRDVTLKDILERIQAGDVGTTYSYGIGSKHDPDLDIIEIAKLIRKDLKNAYPNGKFSVRVDRPQGLTVIIKGIDFPVVNPEWIARRINNHNVKRDDAICFYMPEANNFREQIENIVDAYNSYDCNIALIEKGTDRILGTDNSVSEKFRREVLFDNHLGGFLYQQCIETAKKLGLPTDIFTSIEEETDWWLI
jgi:hypothetical protein